MKIILTSHVFLPDFSSGTEVLTYSTAKELQRQGHQVTVVTGFLVSPGVSVAQRFDSYEYDGIQVRRYFYVAGSMAEQRNAVESEYNNRDVANWFQDILEDFKPDIVHFFHLAFLRSGISLDHEGREDLNPPLLSGRQIYVRLLWHGSIQCPV